jgi:hypothetical protein
MLTKLNNELKAKIEKETDKGEKPEDTKSLDLPSEEKGEEKEEEKDAEKTQKIL